MWEKVGDWDSFSKTLVPEQGLKDELKLQWCYQGGVGKEAA